MWCYAQQTSSRTPLQGAATWKFNSIIPESLSVYSDNFTTIARRKAAMLRVIEYFAKSVKVTQDH